MNPPNILVAFSFSFFLEEQTCLQQEVSLQTFLVHLYYTTSSYHSTNPDSLLTC